MTIQDQKKLKEINDKWNELLRFKNDDEMIDFEADVIKDCPDIRKQYAHFRANHAANEKMKLLNKLESHWPKEEYGMLHAWCAMERMEIKKELKNGNNT